MSSSKIECMVNGAHIKVTGDNISIVGSDSINLGGVYTPKEQDSAMVSAPFPDPKSYIPDPKKHLYVSLAKSIVRIVGYALLLGIPSGWAVAAAIVLVASEVIGIAEELV